ncbi:acyl carrier protein [Kitasatospora sp. NPDC059795]|uniref:acyl carrier protein n=1 Tax=unclassified Kitasatospora TaxID=2633591 RepID=UPI00093B9418|nr:acyl carrier protein [Kitasatospora sp. CB01950]
MADGPIDVAALSRLLRECGGEEPGGPIGPGDLDVPLYELGHDSLTVAQLLTRVGREFGLTVPLDLLEDADTARSLLDMLATMPRVPRAPRPEHLPSPGPRDAGQRRRP